MTATEAIAAGIVRSAWSLPIRVVCLVLAFGMPGCGEPKTVVQGTVTLDGEPLVHANVDFWPAGTKGRPSGAFTDLLGRYRAEVSPYDMRVTVSGVTVIRDDRRKATAAGLEDEFDPVIGEKFRDRDKTVLSVSPVEGKTVIADFSLTRD